MSKAYCIMGLAIHWFRRDLRLEDNAALYHSLKSGHKILCLFIFDKHILDQLPVRDPRVSFIHSEIERLHKELSVHNSGMIVKYGYPKQVWKELISNFDIEAVFTNRDYEPYATERDKEVELILSGENISFHTYKDHVIFEAGEVLKTDGGPYTVFSPYSRRWKEKLNARGVGTNSFYLKSYPVKKYLPNLAEIQQTSILMLSEMGFQKSDVEFPAREVPRSLIKNYGETRNFPGVNGTSKLGIHFRFGTISIREKARKALVLSDVYLNELIWRDFYSQIMAHFPRVVKESFRSEYDNIPWRYDEKEFKAWCEGRTGYPIVDAGMRELYHTGYMHNRVRMITASFLTKHLLMDWRLGEAWFAEKLLDFDLASNNGGWQWAAGCGTDAAPYFRIFNPTSQQEKFDKDLVYIRKWVPEYGTKDYPEPIVDHAFARERCLETYKSALKS
jgi:deoxyribodipyrimidine photo-lyase